MTHYMGRLVFSCSDEEGPIEVVDDAATRTLHFGTSARQTTMFRREPARLALSYTQCMAVSLLFVPEPRSALVLGLGGGALVRFLLNGWADCRVDAVEKRSKIVEVARTYFGLPAGPRLRVLQGDAAEYLQASRRAFDLVLVDLHDSRGMAPVTREADFFERCRRRLNPEGVLAANLWSGARGEGARMLDRLEEAFSGRVLHLPVAGKSNRVAFGLGADVPRLSPDAVQQRAEDLRRRHGVDIPALWDQVEGQVR